MKSYSSIPKQKEIIEEWITDGKARGFGLRNYWAGSIYSALKKL